MLRELGSIELCRRCDEEQFSFRTTAELSDFKNIIGQQRAVDAVQFGIGIRREGYNLFALGPSGTGKQSVVQQYLREKAVEQPTPPDWIYVNDFAHPQKPRALELPPGLGAVVKQDVERLVEELHSAIPSAFESDNYRARKQSIEDELKQRQEGAFNELQQRGEEQNIALVRTRAGIVFAPTKNGEVISPDDFKALPESERERIEANISTLQEQLESILDQIPAWEKELREKVRTLNREVTAFAVGHLIGDLRTKFAELPELIDHLAAMERDVIDNVDDFLRPAEQGLEALVSLPPGRDLKTAPISRRYQINAIFDHRPIAGAPVIYEDHPTYNNLIGQIEYVSHLGSLVTDFSLIKAGALHRANGGYLILDVLKLLQQPYAWEALKRALRSSEIRIEPLGQMLGFLSTSSIEPKPIPLNLKVVLLGDSVFYYLLCALDPDFGELFKVAADFDDQMERTGESSLAYASLVGTLARKECLLPFDRRAVCRIIDRSARMAGDAEKLSTRMGSIVDLLREADYWARQSDHPVVNDGDVQRALDAQIHRSDRIRERIYEEINHGMILIDTIGEKVGQVNGLSVLQLGSFSFGRPSRITARVSLGKGEVIDIEREVELGGPIHSKGVLIISSFLGSRYAPDRPLSLTASLVFEQSYGAVEGDSASAAEMFALLSALADAPLKQSIAVTGSVNQHGQIQPIGGVNEKIEGFFDVCKASGLTGEQGVLIPLSNVRHLMLRKDVVDAVEAAQFHVYSMQTIDDGLEILTGTPAGERGRSGYFPDGSVNRRVEAKLTELAERRRIFATSEKTGHSE